MIPVHRGPVSRILSDSSSTVVSRRRPENVRRSVVQVPRSIRVRGYTMNRSAFGLRRASAVYAPAVRLGSPAAFALHAVRSWVVTASRQVRARSVVS